MNNLSSTLLNTFIILVIVWLIVLIIAIITLTKRKDIIMPIKAFWGMVLFMAPVVGLIFYLIYGFRKKRNGITRFKG